MTSSQIKLGFILLAAQIIMASMTLGFNCLLDKQAQNDGIYTIIENGGK